MIKISPSILAADFANLAHELKMLEEAGADMIHLDIMDGLFVPALTFGPPVIKSLKRHSNLIFEAHLMVMEPEKHLAEFVKAGADIITIHPETTIHLDYTVNTIISSGAKAGIALLPTTSIDVLTYIIDKIDLILIMSVNPGSCGQPFIANQLNKISILAEKLGKKNALNLPESDNRSNNKSDNQRNIMLAVDGGINPATAEKCIEAGADVLISGSYIFSGNYQERISQLKNIK